MGGCEFIYFNCGEFVDLVIIVLKVRCLICLRIINCRFFLDFIDYFKRVRYRVFWFEFFGRIWLVKFKKVVCEGGYVSINRSNLNGILLSDVL